MEVFSPETPETYFLNNCFLRRIYFSTQRQEKEGWNMKIQNITFHSSTTVLQFTCGHILMTSFLAFKILQTFWYDQKTIVSQLN